MDTVLHLPQDSVSIAGVGGSAAADSGNVHVDQHELVQPIRQLLSSVASNHPGTTRPLEEELTQLETSDENFHRYGFIMRKTERDQRCL